MYLGADEPISSQGICACVSQPDSSFFFENSLQFHVSGMFLSTIWPIVIVSPPIHLPHICQPGRHRELVAQTSTES